MTMRAWMICLALAGLMAAVMPVRAAEAAAAPEKAGVRPPPASDQRLPDNPVKSPGFPSALAGKCRTAQDCAAYCAKHPSENGCPKDRKTPP